MTAGGPARFWCAVFCLAAAFAAGSDPVLAQANPFGIGRAPAAAPPDGLVGWLLAQQAAFYRELSSAIRMAKTDGTALIGLVGLAFAYGLFHAAGPGHGKAIISSYVMADGRSLRNGVALSFLAAGIQGAAALAIVTLVVLLAGAGARQVDATVAIVETASYTLILGLGLWLIWRKGRALRKAWAASRKSHAHAHPQAHAHDHENCADPHCGHHHLPPPEALAGVGTRGFLGAAIAAGIRPCTGAIIVLVFAIAQGMFMAGAAAVLAMALGTALITSGFAALAVGFKQTALFLASGRSGFTLLPRLIEFLAALAIAALGAALLTGYLASSS